jgi:molybdopterin converting factor small subunit
MSLHVTVRYFASLREALQRGSEEVATRAATLGELRRELRAAARTPRRWRPSAPCAWR